MNYSSSLISLVEAIVTYVCENKGGDWLSKDGRDMAKDKLQKGLVSKKLKESYIKLRKMRNSIAHSSESYNTASKMLTSLKEGIENLEKLITSE